MPWMKSAISFFNKSFHKIIKQKARYLQTVHKACDVMSQWKFLHTEAVAFLHTLLYCKCFTLVSKRRPRTVIKHQTWVGHGMNFPSRLKTMNEKQIRTTAVLYGHLFFLGVAKLCFLMVKHMKEHLSVAPQNKLCGPQCTSNSLDRCAWELIQTS